MIDDVEYQVLRDGWLVAMDVDRYSAHTIRIYSKAVDDFARWLGKHHPDVGPRTVDRLHVRGWLIETVQRTSSGSARSWMPGLRHFFAWLVEEEEREDDPAARIKMPRPNPIRTPTVDPLDIGKMLDTCSGTDFVSRRDRAIIYVFVDGGLRLAEVAGLSKNDVNVRERMLYIAGKGANRSGPRMRAIALGVKAVQALERYQRQRLRHPFVDRESLWLGAGNRPTLSAEGIKAMLNRRAALVGVKLHPHMFRHTWASAFRKSGGSEGDLMVMGGWTSRTMLDRYGQAEAEERAQTAYRNGLSFGDRL